MKMGTRLSKNELLTILAIAVALVAYLGHGGDWFFWKKAQSIMTVIITFQVFRLSKMPDKYLALLLFAFAINNMADEFLFNPSKLGINEIIFAIVTPIPVIYLRLKWKNLKK